MTCNTRTDLCSDTTNFCYTLPALIDFIVEVWTKMFAPLLRVSLLVLAPLLISSTVDYNDDDRPMPGGWHKIDPTSEQVQEIMSFALQAVQNEHNSARAWRLVRIDSARGQVVAGFNYELKFTFEETSCPANVKNVESTSHCPTTGRGGSCTATVFDQVWTNTRELTEHLCTMTRRSVKRSHQSDVN